MKITIIETGRPPAAIAANFPHYPKMFADLIGPHGDFTFETVALLDGDAFPDPGSLEATLITGSPLGVYDDAPWMGALMDFIRWSAASDVPQVGICFGHQAMAQALGGQVVKSPKGWGIGRHTYEIERAEPWMGDAPASLMRCAVSHQDQVVAPPPGARVITASDFTVFAGLSYAQGPAISFQCHPEFSDAFSAALYRARLGRPLGEGDVAAAIASLDTPSDNALVGRWIAEFYRRNTKEKGGT